MTKKLNWKKLVGGALGSEAANIVARYWYVYAERAPGELYYWRNRTGNAQYVMAADTNTREDNHKYMRDNAEPLLSIGAVNSAKKCMRRAGLTSVRAVLVTIRRFKKEECVDEEPKTIPSRNMPLLIENSIRHVTTPPSVRVRA